VIHSSYYASVQAEIDKVENILRSQAVDYHPDLQKALDIILSSGGKRMRAAITLLVGKMMDANRDLNITLASAIEMLHTATLVHDDLIDGALLRRGMPTLNSQWSPGATVLTGDFLFARAAKLASETNNVRVINIFSNTLGVIVNGELSQLFSKHFQVDRNNYYHRIYAKTASLFETSACTSAILSNASETSIDNMTKFGYNIGMAFQIIDDILDFTGEQATLGKPVGSDLHQGLITLPALHFVETHPDHPIVKNILEKGCIEDDRQIGELIQLIAQSKSIEEAHHEAIGFVQQAINYLQEEPENEYRESLENIARYIVDRKI
jgi:geranylgeranyl pyrophosphate synthase